MEWAHGSKPAGETKKLIAWCRWSNGAGPDHDGLRLWDSERIYDGNGGGITSEYCRTVCKTRCKECPAPLLLPECQAGVAAYTAVSTQWRIGGIGARTGLDYAAVIRTLELYLPRWQREESAYPGARAVWRDAELGELLEDIAIIESAALCADHERRERDKPAGEA